MSDRVLVRYEEPRLEHGPHWRLEIERSASGEPTLFLTIEHQPDSPIYAHMGSKTTIVVENADQVLAPAIAWAASRREHSHVPEEES